MALTSGSSTVVVALTVTNTVDASEALARRYDELNELIGREERHERLYSVDVAGLLPPATVENVLVGKVYDRDGVHLGKKGYEMMGEAIGASLVEIIRARANEERSSECAEHSNVHHFNVSNLKSHPR